MEAEAPQQQEEQSFDQAPAPMEESQGQQQPFQESSYVDPEAPSQPEISDAQLDDMTLMYLSEKLGRQVSSFDEFNQVQEQQQVLDERVDAISRFGTGDRAFSSRLVCVSVARSTEYGRLYGCSRQACYRLPRSLVSGSEHADEEQVWC